MHFKNLLQADEVFFVPGVAIGRDIRGGKKASTQSRPVHDMGIVKLRDTRRTGRKELLSAAHPGILIPMRNGCVGFSKRLEQILIITNERRSINLPVIPNDEDPSFGTKQSLEFLTCGLMIEPVKSLRNGNGVERGIGQTGLLRGGGNGMKPGKVPQVFLGCQAHRLIRLNRRNVKSCFQEQLRKNSRSGTNIRYGCSGL